jgi:DNA polymerase III subunit delta'
VQGHESARRSLAGAHHRGTLPAALLLHGGLGVGKQRLALWVGQLLLCENPSESGPCDACRGCGLALRLEHPDLHWYFPLARPKGASGDRLGDALEESRWAALADFRRAPLRPSHTPEPRGLYLAAARALRKQAQKRPSMGDRQLFIIGEAESLVSQEASPEAANALLKLLEEPPDGTVFILTSNEPGRLLPTIRSRTLPLHLPPLPDSEVEHFLVGTAGAEADAAGRAAALARGSIGRALGFLPDGESIGPLEKLRQDAFHLLRSGLSGGRRDGYAAALGFGPSGARGLTHLLAFVEEWLRDVAAVASGAPDAILNVDARDYLVRVVRERGIHPLGVARAMKALDEARALAAGNVNPQLIVAGLLSDFRLALRHRDRVA